MANPAWRYRPVTQRLGPLYEREFRLLYLARAFSLFGDGLIPVALPFAVFSIDRSPSALGFVLASRSISLVVFLLVAGVVADRLARKVVMIASDIARLAAQATMAALLIAPSAGKRASRLDKQQFLDPWTGRRRRARGKRRARLGSRSRRRDLSR